MRHAELPPLEEPPVPPDYAAVCQQRPDLRCEFQQQPCTPGTAWARARRIGAGLRGQRVLILGDDDLVSLALDRLLPPDVRLQVLEIDPTLNAFLRRHASPRLQVGGADLVAGLPEIHRHRYPAVTCDPMYEWNGLRPFTRSAARALAPGGDLWLSTDPLLHERPHGFAGWMQVLGLELQEHLPGFNRYPAQPAVQEALLEGMRRAWPGALPDPVEQLLRQPWLRSDFYRYRRSPAEGMEPGAKRISPS